MSKASHTPLSEWLTRENVSQAAFARMIGASPVSVSRWCAGDNFPRRDALAAIAEATRGEVTANSFIAMRDCSVIAPSKSQDAA
jgi:DNA-binding transcriptional regulator YdaS (Cro superfamily)